jgi:3-deoxy-manno-octulosonate cytidylyltransferase (CMP-KDO synthetase)
VNRHRRALYFTRQPAPGAHRHIGVYGFGALLGLLGHIPPSELAQAENLEQLEWLDAGLEITVATIDHAPISVNTPEDLEAFREKLR